MSLPDKVNEDKPPETAEDNKRIHNAKTVTFRVLHYFEEFREQLRINPLEAHKNISSCTALDLTCRATGVHRSTINRWGKNKDWLTNRKKTPKKKLGRPRKGERPAKKVPDDTAPASSVSQSPSIDAVASIPS
ncbi:hypothetical protein HDE_07507 [Halotydeus destructor]|nr:hypothetical protein HDE_07507 [Halotydeus destructor]